MIRTYSGLLKSFYLICFSLSDSVQPHGLQPARFLCPCGFSRQEDWSGLPCSPPGDLPDSGMEPRSSTLQADSLPSDLLFAKYMLGVFMVSYISELSYILMFFSYKYYVWPFLQIKCSIHSSLKIVQLLCLQIFYPKYFFWIDFIILYFIPHEQPNFFFSCPILKNSHLIFYFGKLLVII